MAIDIKRIKRTHKDAEISRKIGNVVVETRDLPGEASANLTLEDIERQLAKLAQNVFVAEVKEILPAVKRVNNSGDQVIFEDVARLEITSRQNELVNGLSVYVYQHDFSSLQEIVFERSIGQVFPVSIQGTEFSIRERRVNELSNKYESDKLATLNEDELIAIGKISLILKN